MEWRKLGLIWGPDGSRAWARHSALQPTPIVLDDRIRVFVGVRDGEGVGRAAFVDVDAEDPTRVLRVSDQPVLDIGVPGTFDDNGVIPCAVVARGSQLYLFYAGYQLGHKVKFLAFGGLAISDDGGESFHRYSEVPVFERTADDLYFKAPHCVMFDEGIWRMWYSAGSGFIIDDNGVNKPKYDTWYVESEDGIHPDGPGRIAMPLDEAAGEYRNGRATVLRTGDLYRMFFLWATTSSRLHLGYAESADAIHWTRDDAKLGLGTSASGFDSNDIAYPNAIECRGKYYLFYNGNDYGKAGFGCAELVSW
jgi:hypothetical protein